ncbi:hypothetical protein HQ520_09785 [bacterium]|nr:hypothetical protein [bacterium]
MTDILQEQDPICALLYCDKPEEARDLGIDLAKEKARILVACEGRGDEVLKAVAEIASAGAVILPLGQGEIPEEEIPRRVVEDFGGLDLVVFAPDFAMRSSENVSETLRRLALGAEGFLRRSRRAGRMALLAPPERAAEDTLGKAVFEIADDWRHRKSRAGVNLIVRGDVSGTAVLIRSLLNERGKSGETIDARGFF